MRVRLNRKLANIIDGLDVSGYEVGDMLDLPQHDALLLLAEGWAEIEQPAASRLTAPRVRDDQTVAHDRPRQRVSKRRK